MRSDQRSARFRRIRLESLETRRVLAALSPGNLLVSYQAIDSVREYNPSGALQQELSTSLTSTDRPRDITVDQDGNIQVFFGTFSPQLESIDPLTGFVDVNTFTGWSTANNTSYGGIADFGNYVFLTDMSTGGATEKGIVRVDTTDNSFVRFATDRGFTDVTLGRNGLIYALEEFSPARNFRAFDPVSLAPISTLSLDFVDHRGIAVDADGNLYTPMWSGGGIRKYDSAGTLITTLDTGINNLQDIDIHSDGRLVVGSRFGDVVLTDTDLTTFSTFNTGDSSPTFVAFTEDDPLPPSNESPVATSFNVDVPEGDRVVFSLLGSDDSTDLSELTYTITSLPASGRLTIDGVPVLEGESYIGAPEIEFEFGVSDDLSTAMLQYFVSDGGSPSLASELATVTLAGMQSVADGTVMIDVDGIVRIGGTSSNDKFVIQASDSYLLVKHNGTTISNTIPLSSVNEIRGWGRDGDDLFNVKGLSIATKLFGQAGNDRLYGGSDRDFLFGGSGNDTLRGRSGSDFLVGGLGDDILRGNRGDDILVGGRLIPTLTNAEVDAVLNDWDQNQQPQSIESTLAVRVIDTESDDIRGGNNIDFLFVSNGDSYSVGSDSVVIL